VLLLAALLPGCAGTAAAATVTPGPGPVAAERFLPRAGSRLIVQPAAIGLVGAAELRSARLSVRDGCGRTLDVGALGLEGGGAAVPLPAQDAGPGTWEVTWTTRDAAGRDRSGRWTFDVVEGTPCGSAAAAAAGAAGPGPGGGHHGASALAGRPGAGPSLLLLVGVALAVLLLGVGGIAFLGRRGKELAVAVAAQAVVLLLVGGASPQGLAFAVTTAALVAGSVVAVAASAGGARRVLLAGLAAGAATATVAVLWAGGRAVLLSAPASDTLVALPWQAGATAVAAAVLCVGGWYGARDAHPA
jgi:hypothetical protein